MSASHVPAHLREQMEDDAIHQDEQAEKGQEVETTSTAAELAEEMQACKEEADRLTGLAKEQTDRYNQIRKIELPDLMRKLGMVNSAGKGSFTFSGGRVHLEGKVHANLRKDDKPQFFEWLRGNGAEDLIKEDVNAQTLSAFVRERRAEGLTDPPYIVAFEETTAKMTKVSVNKR